MKRLGWLLVLMGLTAYSFADVYRWTDAQGTVHFSDMPHTGASIVQLPANSMAEPKADSSNNKAANNPASSNADQTVAATPAPTSTHLYTALKIQQPQDNATIWDNNGTIQILVNLTPALMTGDTLQALVDGKVKASTQQGNALTVTGIDRGTHQVQVQVIGAAGKILSSSQIITVHLHKASVANKPKH